MIGLHNWRQHVAVIAVVLAVLCAWALPLVYRVDIGQWDAPTVVDFYDSEYGAGTTFRWSEPQAALRIPALGSGTYTMRMSASANISTKLDITVNNITQTVTVSPGFAPYDVAVAVPLQWREPLTVTLTVAEPQVVARRPIGVAIDEVRFIPTGWHLPAVIGVWWSLFAIAVLTHLLRWINLPWLWRWCGAAVVVLAVVLGRHGNAATLLELTAMLGCVAIVSAHCVQLSRRQQIAVVVVAVAVCALVLGWRGVAAWHPLWQLVVLIGSATLLRVRRFVWRGVRPYRHIILAGVLVWLATYSWIFAGLSGVIAIMYVLGKQVDASRSMLHAIMYAGHSLFPLLDAWLCGRGMPRGPQKQMLRYIGLDYLRGVAMFMVLVTHLPTIVAYTPVWFFDTVAWIGKISVDAFFILSGWLIGGSGRRLARPPVAFQQDRWPMRDAWGHPNRCRGCTEEIRCSHANRFPPLESKRSGRRGRCLSRAGMRSDEPSWLIGSPAPIIR